MAKQFKKPTAEEKERLNKAILRKLGRIKKLTILDDAFRQMPKLNND